MGWDIVETGRTMSDNYYILGLRKRFAKDWGYIVNYQSDNLGNIIHYTVSHDRDNKMVMKFREDFHMVYIALLDLTISSGYEVCALVCDNGVLYDYELWKEPTGIRQIVEELVDIK